MLKICNFKCGSVGKKMIIFLSAITQVHTIKSWLVSQGLPVLSLEVIRFSGALRDCLLL